MDRACWSYLDKEVAAHFNVSILKQQLLTSAEDGQTETNISGHFLGKIEETEDWIG